MSEKRFYQKRKQMGSPAEVIIYSDNDIQAEEIYKKLWETMDAYESRFSRFKVDSELTLFNDSNGTFTELSSEFINMLLVCRHFNKLTTGIFNPLILPVLQQAGYKGSWPEVATYDKKLDYSSRKVADYSDVVINKSQAKIPKNTALDFGGIGKGYGLDVASSALESMGVKNYCISFGGDIICRGCDGDRNWKIGVSYVHDHSVAVAYFTNKTGEKLAIASSTVVRRQGEGWNHLIDPRTGEPTKSEVLMATAVTRTGVAADICAKYFLLEPDGKLNDPSESDEPLSIFYQYAEGNKTIQKNSFIESRT